MAEDVSRHERRWLWVRVRGDDDVLNPPRLSCADVRERLTAGGVTAAAAAHVEDVLKTQSEPVHWMDIVQLLEKRAKTQRPSTRQ